MLREGVTAVKLLVLFLVSETPVKRQTLEMDKTQEMDKTMKWRKHKFEILFHAAKEWKIVKL